MKNLSRKQRIIIESKQQEAERIAKLKGFGPQAKTEEEFRWGQIALPIKIVPRPKW